MTLAKPPMFCTARQPSALARNSASTTEVTGAPCPPLPTAGAASQASKQVDQQHLRNPRHRAAAGHHPHHDAAGDRPLASANGEITARAFQAPRQPKSKYSVKSSIPRKRARRLCVQQPQEDHAGLTSAKDPSMHGHLLREAQRLPPGYSLVIDFETHDVEYFYGHIERAEAVQN